MKKNFALETTDFPSPVQQPSESFMGQSEVGTNLIMIISLIMTIKTLMVLRSSLPYQAT